MVVLDRAVERVEVRTTRWEQEYMAIVFGLLQLGVIVEAER